MKRMIRINPAAFLLILAALIRFSHASIKCHLAVESNLTERYGTTLDELWYRAEVYKDIKNHALPVDSFYVDSIGEPLPPTNAFARYLENGPQSRYLVHGEAESFMVQETGEYTFFAKADEGMFIFIDEELLTPHPDTVFLYETVLEPYDQFRGKPLVRYYTVKKHLTAGNHTFKFYFWESTSLAHARLRWNVPGSFDTVTIPAATFGERKQRGPLEARMTWNLCMPEYGQCPVNLTFGAEVTSGVWEGDTVIYMWDFNSDSIADYQTSNSSFDTLIGRTNNDNAETITFVMWIEANGKRSPVVTGAGGVCNAIQLTCPPLTQVRCSPKAVRQAPWQSSAAYDFQGKRLRQDSFYTKGTNAPRGLYILRKGDLHAQGASPYSRIFLAIE